MNTISLKENPPFDKNDFMEQLREQLRDFETADNQLYIPLGTVTVGMNARCMDFIVETLISNPDNTEEIVNASFALFASLAKNLSPDLLNQFYKKLCGCLIPYIKRKGTSPSKIVTKLMQLAR